MLDVFQLMALRVDEELETILYQKDRAMEAKRVEDLTTEEITEIRFKSSAIQRRREALRKDRDLHEATMHWTRNPGIKKTMERKIAEINAELQKICNT